MRTTKFFLLLTMIMVIATLPADAKKYKWTFNGKTPEVYQLSQGQNGRKIVKAWAVAGNADKAIIQAKIDAVDAALFHGIPYDESTHGMGVSNLNPLVTKAEYEAYKGMFDNFFKKGEFLNYVSNVNSNYPTGENNMSVPGGRRVGINLNIDYMGLQKWLENQGIKKGVGGHFK